MLSNTNRLIGLFAPIATLNTELAGVNFPESASFILRLFGALVLTIGIISVLSARITDKTALLIICGCLAFYNILAAYFSFTPSAAADKLLPGGILHVVFAIGFIYQSFKLRTSS